MYLTVGEILWLGFLIFLANLACDQSLTLELKCICTFRLTPVLGFDEEEIG